MALYGVVGADGFAIEVIPVAREMIISCIKDEEFELVFVDKSPIAKKIINGYKVVDEETFIADKNKNKYFNIAIADYKIREKVANRFLSANIKPFQIKASNVVVMDNNKIGEGAILCPFTTITSNTSIGRFFHANIYSYIAHDCVIGDFVTFAPNVHCNGRVVVEDFAYIGTGAVIKQGTLDKSIVIGRGAIVGMGAVVTKSIAPYATVVGNPAIELKRK